jgi:hypothetical protein
MDTYEHCQIGVGRLVSTKNEWFSGSMLIYQGTQLMRGKCVPIDARFQSPKSNDLTHPVSSWNTIMKPRWATFYPMKPIGLIFPGVLPFFSMFATHCRMVFRPSHIVDLHPFTGLTRHHLYRTGGFQREIEQGDDLRRSRTMGPWGCGRTGLLSWHGITMIRPLYWDLPSGKQT